MGVWQARKPYVTNARGNVRTTRVKRVEERENDDEMAYLWFE